MSELKISDFGIRDSIEQQIKNSIQMQFNSGLLGAIRTGIEILSHINSAWSGRSSDVVREANNWVNRTINSSSYSHSDVLEGYEIKRRLERKLAEQREKLRNLRRKGDEILSKWNSCKEMVKKYLGDETVERIGKRVVGFENEIKKEGHSDSDLNKLEKKIRELEKDVSELMKKASEKERELIREENVKKYLELKRNLTEIYYSLNRILHEIPDGLKEAYSSDFEEVKNWIKKTGDKLKETGIIKEREQEDKIKQLIMEMELLIKGGINARERFLSCQEEALKIKTNIMDILGKIEIEFNGGKSLLSSWWGEQEIASISKEIELIKDKIENGYLAEAEKRINELKDDIRLKLEKALEQEEKHQKRLYVLKALRQACMDMGFGEKFAPKYEKEGDKKSRIVFQVDTYNHGLVTFYLSLDSIVADSEINRKYCLDEFDKISANLLEKFEVRTKFKIVGEEDKPRLIRKGERDEPEGIAMKMGKQ